MREPRGGGGRGPSGPQPSAGCCGWLASGRQSKQCYTFGGSRRQVTTQRLTLPGQALHLGPLSHSAHSGSAAADGCSGERRGGKWNAASAPLGHEPREPPAGALAFQRAPTSNLQSRRRPSAPDGQPRRTIVTWLILPVVICLSQRLSHACLSISNLYGETANGSLNQLSFI